METATVLETRTWTTFDSGNSRIGCLSDPEEGTLFDDDNVACCVDRDVSHLTAFAFVNSVVVEGSSQSVQGEELELLEKNEIVVAQLGDGLEITGFFQERSDQDIVIIKLRQGALLQCRREHLRAISRAAG